MFRRKYKKTSIKTGKFKSRLESNVWDSLPHYKKELKFSYETLKLDYIVQRKYIPDFIVEFPSGRTMILEVKGYYRPQERTKMLAAKALNPEADIRFVFAQDNFILKGSKTRYSDWCRKHGFPFCFGRPPKEWFLDEEPVHEQEVVLFESRKSKEIGEKVSRKEQKETKRKKQRKRPWVRKRVLL